MSIFPFHFYLIIGAVLVDLVIGDPRWFPHPVVLMGKVISFLDRIWNKGRFRRLKGVALIATVVGGTFGFVYALLVVANWVHPIFGLVIEVYLVSSTIAIKGLHQAGKDVFVPLVKGDIILARKKLSYIVGRDTEKLPEKEVVRGTVETVAENTVDAIISPLFWALLGGAPLAMAYRAVNTLDSMVGYKNEKYEQFGWASARLDDVANWIPARFTALSMWLFSWLVPGSLKRNAVRVTLRDANKHPSPNSGLPEAMVAGLLGVVLGGKNTYQGVASFRAKMGNRHRTLEPPDIRKASVYMHGAWIVFVITVLVIKIIIT